jgi:Tfp pilus assembly protein PilZ
MGEGVTRMRDRRTSPRIPVGLPVVEIDEETTYFQYATDLSDGGMFLQGTAPHPVGSEITVLFKLPGSTDISRVPAIVVGNTDGARRGTHLKFLDHDESDARARVRDYVSRQG